MPKEFETSRKSSSPLTGKSSILKSVKELVKANRLRFNTSFFCKIDKSRYIDCLLRARQLFFGCDGRGRDHKGFGDGDDLLHLPKHL